MELVDFFVYAEKRRRYSRLSVRKNRPNERWGGFIKTAFKRQPLPAVRLYL